VLALGVTGLGVAWEQRLLDFEDGSLIYPTCVLLTLLFGWSLCSWRLAAGSWFDPYSLFLAAAYVFNAGQAFLEVFHLNPQGILLQRFSPFLTLQTLLLVALGLTALHLGALLSVLLERRPLPAQEPSAGGATLADVRWVGWGLLLLSAPPTIFILRKAFVVVLTSGYQALYQQDEGVGVYAAPKILSLCLVPAALFLLAGSKGAPFSRAASALVILGNAVCQLFLGYRYYAVMPVVAYVWLYDVCLGPVSRGLLLGAAAVLLCVVFPLIRLTRNLSGAERLSAETFTSALSTLDHPAVEAVGEMGGSMETVAYTLELVPSVREHDHGMVYIYAVSTFIPNLFWKVHPAIAHGTPSDWLIWTVDPYTATRGGSLGYSFIAEAYLCFGWAGTPLVLGVVGFLYARFVLWARAPGSLAAAKLATVAAFASFFTFYVREESATILRSLFWYSLLPYLLVFVVSRCRRPRLTQP
jgi:hypothetical protein